MKLGTSKIEMTSLHLILGMQVNRQRLVCDCSLFRLRIITMFNYQHMFGDGHAYPKDRSPNLQYLSNEADTRKDKNLVIGNSG